MFAYLEGKLVFRSPSMIIMDLGGIGYEVQITQYTYEQIKDLDRTRLFIHQQIREDAWILYGFAQEAERTSFRHLLSIGGVGAATARQVLSALKPEDLARTVANEDHHHLEKVKGIGAKTAKRIVLELKGKLLAVPSSSESPGGTNNTNVEDALNALVQLGIQRGLAERAMKKLKDPSSLTVEEIIKQVLKGL